MIVRVSKNQYQWFHVIHEIEFGKALGFLGLVRVDNDGFAMLDGGPIREHFIHGILDPVRLFLVFDGGSDFVETSGLVFKAENQSYP